MQQIVLLLLLCSQDIVQQLLPLSWQQLKQQLQLPLLLPVAR